MATNELEWTSESGNQVTVTAERGSLFVTLDGDDVEFENERATLGHERGVDVLNCGKQRDENGEKFIAWVPLDVPKSDVEQLREDSKNTDPLAYEVTETTKVTRVWGERKERTELRLSATKNPNEMTDKESKLATQIHSENDVPDDAEAGDVFTPDDLLDDARTDEERDQDALDEAAETGEEVVIKKWTGECSDSSKECNLDKVSRVATPEGEIETRRTHTY